MANNLTAQHCLGLTAGGVAGAMSKAVEAVGLSPAQFFDASVTPITNPGYVNLKNSVYRATHNTNSCLARAVNAPPSGISVGIGSPLLSFDQMACASRSVKQRFGDYPNNIRAFSEDTVSTSGGTFAIAIASSSTKYVSQRTGPFSCPCLLVLL